MQKGIYIGEMVKSAWSVFRKNWGFLIGVTFLYFATPYITYALAAYLQPTQPLLSGIFLVLYYILLILVNIGLLIALPITLLSTAFAYRKLVASTS